MSRFPFVVFVRTGWMVWYDQAREPHGPIGGGSYNLDNVGSEVNNFRPYRGRFYGYVRTPNAGFNVRRIAPSERSDTSNGVLVLMYATNPDGVGQYLVGWYQGARCHAEHRGDRPGGLDGIWNFEAAAARSVLLPLDARICWAPSRHEGGFGQANIRYAYAADGTPTYLPWMSEAVAFARRYRGPNLVEGADPGELPTSGARGQGWRSDPVARKVVEMHAMAQAVRFFRAKGYDVDAEVHRYRPFDLLCTHRRTRAVLRVEVKGSTESAGAVFVTAGEVRSARAEEPPTALFVVSEIQLRQTTKGWRARGGVAGWLPSWSPSDGDLDPTEYRYRLPRLRRA